MQLIHQLKDEELTDLLLRSEELEIRKFFATAPQSLRSATERPSWFWQKQQAAIRGRVAAKHDWFRPLTTWAGALALIVLALLLLDSGPTPAHKAVQAQADPDQELLVAVESAVDSELPAALEPAALLANEISNPGRQASAPHRVSKENQNEN